MRTTTLVRLLGALCLAGSATYAAAAPATAATPNWSMSVVDLPSEVANGAGAAYQVTITNNGPSNISQLFLVTRTTDSPVLLTTTQGSCSQSGPLLCSFGALGAGQSVTVLAGYVTPATGSSYDPVFQANSNGATFSDSKSRSHGDTLQDPNETATILNGSGDFGGGFSFDTGTVQNNQAVGKNNIQATKVTPPASDIIVTVEDNLGAGTFTCGTSCAGHTLFGDWSRVTVDKGETFGSLFPVTLTVYGSKVPSGANVNNIGLVHVLGDGTTQLLTDRCGATPTLNCVTVTKVGNNFSITGWVDQNGGLKGFT
jgi:hypothetical protein